MPIADIAKTYKSPDGKQRWIAGKIYDIAETYKSPDGKQVWYPEKPTTLTIQERPTKTIPIGKPSLTGFQPVFTIPTLPTARETIRESLKRQPSYGIPAKTIQEIPTFPEPTLEEFKEAVKIPFRLGEVAIKKLPILKPEEKEVLINYSKGLIEGASMGHISPKGEETFARTTGHFIGAGLPIGAGYKVGSKILGTLGKKQVISPVLKDISKWMIAGGFYGGLEKIPEEEDKLQHIVDTTGLFGGLIAGEKALKLGAKLAKEYMFPKEAMKVIKRAKEISKVDVTLPAERPLQPIPIVSKFKELQLRIPPKVPIVSEIPRIEPKPPKIEPPIERTFKDIADDLYTALLTGRKLGAIGLEGVEQISLTSEQIAARERLVQDVKRLAEEARKSGKSFERYMKEQGLDKSIITSMQKIAKEDIRKTSVMFEGDIKETTQEIINTRNEIAKVKLDALVDAQLRVAERLLQKSERKPIPLSSYKAMAEEEMGLPELLEKEKSLMRRKEDLLQLTKAERIPVISPEQVIKKVTGVELPRREIITTEEEFLKEKLRSEVRGAKTGFISGKEWMKQREALNLSIETRRKIASTIENKEIYSPSALKKLAKETKVEIPDDVLREIEEAYANRIISRIEGYVEPKIKRLKREGVREEIINSIRIQNEYPLKDLVKIKREPTGEISAVISKRLLAQTDEAYKGKGQEQRIKKFSLENLKRGMMGIFEGFEVPQQFFKRIGLKEILYDPIRQGERDTKDLLDEIVPEIRNMFRGLSKKERSQITDFFAIEQGKAKEMELAGIKHIGWDDLNLIQRNAITKWRSFNKRYKDKVLMLAYKHGYDVKELENYFPIYTRKDLININGVTPSAEVTRKDPFFGSLIERLPKVPYELYERDALENALSYAQGMARFLKLGEKILPIKYFINSEEFATIVGGDNLINIKKWLQYIVSPSHPEDLAGKVMEDIVRFLRRAGVYKYLGLNPIVIMKQGISYLDFQIIDQLPLTIPAPHKEVINSLTKASVSERLPEIGVVDLNTKADRFLLAGITWADKMIAKGVFDKLLSKELMLMERENIKIPEEGLRQALRRVSDRLDLGVGGITPAQRPPFYRTELGKMALAFTSTINSRFQFYIENAIEGIDKKDAFLIAKVLTAWVLSAYAERTFENLSPVWEEAKEMAGDIAKTMGGNIPVLGGLIYALDFGNWYYAPVFGNIADAFRQSAEWKDKKESIGRVIFGWAEVFGLPAQIRKTWEGIEVIREGGVREKPPRERLLVPVDDPIEQFRHFIKGKWGGLEARRYVKQIGKPKEENGGD